MILKDIIFAYRENITAKLQCKACLENAEVTDHDKRQEYDIPPVKIEVTEHRAEIKQCPVCGCINHAQFPSDITKTTQYGSNIKSHIAYFNVNHHTPIERTCDIFEDVFGHRISEGTVLKAVDECGEKVTPSVDSIKSQLKESEVLNADESGIKVNGKGNWLHVASTSELTHYEVHKKRGQEAMDAIGILPEFKGTMVHDHWKSYYNYTSCEHAECNAHILRELKFVKEQYNQQWAGDMSGLLIEIKEEVEQPRENNNNLAPAKVFPVKDAAPNNPRPKIFLTA